jgi:hypothetical protein
MLFSTPFFFEYWALDFETLHFFIDFIDISIFFRFILLAEIIRYTSILSSYKGKLISKLSKIEINDKLLIRSWLNMNPTTTLCMSAAFIITVSSYCLYVFERKEDLRLFVNGN